MRKIFFITLLAALALACEIEPYHPKTNGKAHREFTLKFQYACRKETLFDSCKGEVFWNGEMIYALAPEDRVVHDKIIKVYVNKGKNSLKFVGTGTSDRKGITIDNVRLLRYGTEVNICVNGDFEQPKMTEKKWKILQKIPGWKGCGIEVGKGDIYNDLWSSQVVELDSTKNSEIIQTWKFDKDYFLITPEKGTKPNKEENQSNEKQQDIVEESSMSEELPEVDLPNHESDMPEQLPEVDLPNHQSDMPEIVDDEPSEELPEVDLPNHQSDMPEELPEVDLPNHQSDMPEVVPDSPKPEPKPAILIGAPLKPSADKYTLKFQYACKKNRKFDTCKGDVLWNGKKILQVTPSDHEVHNKVAKVSVQKGENVLRFEGAGVKDGFGLSIDNVKLIQISTGKNIVINGGFERPDLRNKEQKWNMFDNIPGWTGKDIEIGWGKIYNKNWQSQVCELDGRKNVHGHVEQKWKFDGEFNLVEEKADKPSVEKYTLKFQYACRKNQKFETCKGDVLWNGKKIVHIAPSDHKVHNKVAKVSVKEGQNVLRFEGAGVKDSYGLTIDNVKLIQTISGNDIIVNGGFEKPNLKDKEKKWKIQDKIPGWKGKDIEVGWGKIYNKNWNSQVCELDGKKDVHGYVEQKWDFDGEFNLLEEFTPGFIVDAPEVVEDSTPLVKPAVMPPSSAVKPAVISPKPAIKPAVLPSAVKPALKKQATLLTSQPESKVYIIQFEYACRKNIQFDSCQGNVFWNGDKALHIVPSDHKVHRKRIQVDVVPGDNTVKFQGAGKMDTYGLTIDNFKLYEKAPQDNIAVNGDFEKPDVKKGWTVKDEIPGWKGKGIEIGYGTIYNQGWNSQVVELDGHDHGYLSQTWNFDKTLTPQ